MRIASILTAMALFGSSVRADDVVRQLPKDGAWVLYHFTEKWDDGTERTLQFMISLVGQTTIKNEKCRWIELKLKSDGAKSWSVVYKWLVSEKNLTLGGTALANAHKTWRKWRDKNPREFNLKESIVRLYLFAPPPLKGAKKIGKIETVEWQQGQLKCDVAVVRAHYEFPTETTDTVFHLKLHKRVPFGVAAAKLTVDSSDGVQGTIEYWLMDMGANAKSEIPEAK